MASILTAQIITDAQAALTNYQTECERLYKELETTISNLRTDAFVGDASNGYDQFFREQATPPLTTNLYGNDEALIDSLRAMLGSIKEQLLDTVDPGLGDANRNAGN